MLVAQKLPRKLPLVPRSSFTASSQSLAGAVAWRLRLPLRGTCYVWFRTQTL